MNFGGSDLPASIICFARFGRWFSSASMVVVSAVSSHARNDLRQLVPPGGLSVMAGDALVLGRTVAELPWRTVQCARTDIAAAARSSVISCVRLRQRAAHKLWQAAHMRTSRRVADKPAVLGIAGTQTLSLAASSAVAGSVNPCLLSSKK